MKFEVIERGLEWIVQTDDVEAARFELQEQALDYVAALLSEAGPIGGAVSLCVRYEARTGEPHARISK